MKVLYRQTACASGYARGVAQFLEICRKTEFFRGRFWGPPGFIKCIGGTILASKIWTLFWPPWAAGGPLLGRLGIHFWGGFWCPYGLSEVAPRTPQKRTPGRPSGPKWRPHFGCENSSACEAYTHICGLPLRLLRVNKLPAWKGPQCHLPPLPPSAQPLQIMLSLHVSPVSV